MLENIRGKIQTVQQDLTSSLKQLNLTDKIGSNSSKRSSPMKRNLKVDSSEVDLNAGADLLNHYQQHWESLHKRTEEIGSSADNCATLVEEIESIVTRKKTAVDEYLNLISTLPTMLNESINSVNDDLAKLTKNISTLEEILCKLEIAKQDEEMKSMALNKKYEVARYAERKAMEFETIKVNYATNHAERVKEYEKVQKIRCRERELAFQAAFEDELNQYKKYGKIERNPNLVKPVVLSLEEVEVEPAEEDTKALDEFLSEDGEPSVSTTSTVARESKKSKKRIKTRSKQ